MKIIKIIKIITKIIHEVWRDEIYLQALARAANCVWGRGLLRKVMMMMMTMMMNMMMMMKGPGLCHGVAGSGYVFLVMHRSEVRSGHRSYRTTLRLTGDLTYLYRALKFAEFFFSEHFR